MSLIPSHRENAIDSGLPALWQAAEVAKILGISVKTVHKLVREGKLACVQVTARERRFTYEQVEDYVRDQSTSVRVDRRGSKPVSSTPKKGGVKKSVGLSRTGLREEIRSWR
jgi:excisionase family DNA binding protein